MWCRCGYAKAAFETINAYRMMTGHFPTDSEDGLVGTYTFTASAYQRVRVSLTWQKRAALHETVPHVYCDPTEVGIADLDLCIFDPDGILIGDWRADDNNTEIADFISSKAGTYRIEVYLHDSLAYEGCFGIAWWLGPINNLSSSG